MKTPVTKRGDKTREIRKAYMVVLRELKKVPRCEEDAVGCYQCAINRMADDLTQLKEMLFDWK